MFKRTLLTLALLIPQLAHADREFYSAFSLVNGATGGSLTLSGNLTFSAASAKLLPGATSFTFRNNADSASNIIIADNGSLTLREKISWTSAEARLVGGSTNFAITNNSETVYNLAIADDGTITVRNDILNTTAGFNLYGAGTTSVGSTTATSLRFMSNSLARWTIDSGGALTQDVTNGGDFVFNASTGIIRQGTSDAADNKAIVIAGGGSNAENRGAWIYLTGNEHVNAGSLNLYTGTTSSSNLSLVIGNAAAKFKFMNASTVTMWDIDNSGNINQSATAGGSFFMPRALNTTSVGMVLGQSARVADQSSAALIASSDVTFNIQAVFQQSTNDVNGNIISFNKTRNTAFTADTIVANGDAIATLQFQGADGASFRPAAAIRVEVDGTPGASDMPGRLLFQTTPDGSATLVERLRISNNGSLGLERTNTTGGTTGAQTIDKMAGSVNFAAAATSLVVTNSLVSTSSNVFAQAQCNDAGVSAVSKVVPAAGSFTIFLNTGPAAECRVAFWVTN